MLGVKTCRAACTCCAGRALALSASQSVRGPWPARRYGMQGLARRLHAWRWRMWQCLVWPPTHGGALLWRHMHKVYTEEVHIPPMIDGIKALLVHAQHDGVCDCVLYSVWLFPSVIGPLWNLWMGVNFFSITVQNILVAWPLPWTTNGKGRSNKLLNSIFKT